MKIRKKFLRRCFARIVQTLGTSKETLAIVCQETDVYALAIDMEDPA